MEEEVHAANGKKGRKVIKRSTAFKARIDDLPDAHWEAIVDGARKHMVKRRRGRKPIAEVIEVVTDDDGGDDDAILFDPMFAT